MIYIQTSFISRVVDIKIYQIKEVWVKLLVDIVPFQIMK